MLSLDEIEIEAPVPSKLRSNNEEVTFEFAPEILRNYRNTRRSTKFFEAYTLIAGVQMDINLIDEIDDLVSLKNTKYIFRGIKRPRNGGDDGSGIYAYVIHPKESYKYLESIKCLAKKVEIPDDICFVTYVEFFQPSETEIKGRILNWTWVETSHDGRPIDHKNRYEEEVEFDV